MEGLAIVRAFSLSLQSRLWAARQQRSLARAKPHARPGAAGGSTRCPEPDLLRGGIRAQPGSAGLCAQDRPLLRHGARRAAAPPPAPTPCTDAAVSLRPAPSSPGCCGATACPHAAADGRCGPVGAALGILLLQTQADCPPDGTAYSLRNI